MSIFLKNKIIYYYLSNCIFGIDFINATKVITFFTIYFEMIIIDSLLLEDLKHFFFQIMIIIEGLPKIYKTILTKIVKK